MKNSIIIIFISICFVAIAVSNAKAEKISDSDISNALLLEKLNANIELTKMFIMQTDKRFEQIDKRFEQVDKQINMVFTLSLWGFGIVTTFLTCIGAVLIRLSSRMAVVENEIGAIKRIEKVEDTNEIIIDVLRELKPDFSLRNFKKQILAK